MKFFLWGRHQPSQLLSAINKNRLSDKELAEATECLIFVHKKNLCESTLHRMLFHKAPEVREAAVHAALFLYTPKMLNKLKKLATTDTSELVRLAAIFAINQLEKENGAPGISS